MNAQRRTLVVDGSATSYLEAGSGEPVVLLHGGEFGAGAEIGWEHTIDALAERYRVLAPDMLGFGGSAKVVDFTDGRGLRIRHIARLLALLGIESAHFVGNSMGAINLLVDATSDTPRLPMRSLVAICGGGEIQSNEHVRALYDYDATLDGMRRIVTALFHSPSYPADETYVRRRYGRVSPRARGKRWRRPVFAAPAPNSRRPRRADAPTNASPSRSSSSREPATSSSRRAGPRRSPNRSRTPATRWCPTPGTAPRSSNPRPSTTSS